MLELQVHLALFEFKRSPFYQSHNLHHHFQIGFRARRFKAPVQALGQIDAQARNRLFPGRRRRFLLFSLRGNVGLWLFLPQTHIWGLAGLCVLPRPAALECGDDLSG
jgi:hypothetical protein